MLLKANRQAKQSGLRAREPSLLAGLLFDDRGNRLTPCHAVKNDKRYRYYVSQAVIQHGSAHTGSARRIPAHDIEDLVLRQLQGLLGSTHQLNQALTLPTDEASTHTTLNVAAKYRASALGRLAPAEIRALLKSIVSRITIGEDSVEALIIKSRLRAALLGSSVATSAKEQQGATGTEDSYLRLTVDAKLKRCGRELRLILPGASEKEASTHLDVALIKAMARGYSWYEKLISGKAESLQSLAADVGVNKRYVSRVVRCALLAPDIVELILEGRQPPEMTLNRLLYNMPMDWVEQRRSFGITNR